MTDSWQAINNLANMAGLAGFAISGAKSAVAGYQAYASPYTSLTESERKLERVKSRLQGLSRERREEIEIAIRSRASNCKSLKDLEKQLQELMDMYDVLSKGYGEVTFADRHLPYSEFRKDVWILQTDAMVLLNDTLTTTVPYLMDKGSSPENPMERPSSPKSPGAVSTPSAPLPDASSTSGSLGV